MTIAATVAAAVTGPTGGAAELGETLSWRRRPAGCRAAPSPAPRRPRPAPRPRRPVWPGGTAARSGTRGCPAIQHPAPVGGLGDHDPDRLAHRAGQMAHRGVDRDHQVEVLHQRRRLAEIGQVVRQVGHAGELLHASRSAAGIGFCNETKARRRRLGQRPQPRQRHRAAAVVRVRRAAGPGQADPLLPGRQAGRPAARARPRRGPGRPSGRAPAPGSCQAGLEQVRQAGQPAMRRVARHVVPAVAILRHARECSPAAAPSRLQPRMTSSQRSAAIGM